MGNAASAVPYGSHSSLLNTTLICTEASGQSIPVPFDISATAPLASETEIYFTDIYAHADFGPTIYELVENTTVYFSTNASPATFALMSSRVVGGDDTDARVPAEGVAIAGPFQMVNDFAHLKVRYLTVDARNGDIAYVINCTIPEHIVISTVNAGLSSANTAPANGFRASFPDTPAGYKSEIANFPVACVEGSYNFSLQATIPQSLPASSAFDISNAVTFLTTDVGDETAFVAQYGVNVGEQAPGIAAQFVNAQYSTIDLARDFTATDPDTSNPLSGGAYTDGTPQRLTIAAPHQGSLTYSRTAGSSGIVSVAYRFISGTLYTTDGNSNFYCPNSTANVLLTAPIV